MRRVLGPSTFLPMILFCFPPVGEILCEILLARTICYAWLIDPAFVRLIPMMVTRMVVSLRKFASERQPHPLLEAPNALPMGSQNGHSPRAVDGIPLSVLKAGQARKPVGQCHPHEGFCLRLIHLSPSFRDRTIEVGTHVLVSWPQKRQHQSDIP